MESSAYQSNSGAAAERRLILRLPPRVTRTERHIWVSSRRPAMSAAIRHSADRLRAASDLCRTAADRSWHPRAAGGCSRTAPACGRSAGCEQSAAAPGDVVAGHGAASNRDPATAGGHRRRCAADAVFLPALRGLRGVRGRRLGVGRLGLGRPWLGLASGGVARLAITRLGSALRRLLGVNCLVPTQWPPTGPSTSLPSRGNPGF